MDNFIIDDLKGINRFTENAKAAVVGAHEMAERFHNPEVLPIHLFLALLDHPTTLILRIFEKVGLDIDKTRSELTNVLSLNTSLLASSPVFSAAIKELINKSYLIAENLSHVYIGTEHLLMAMLEISGEDFIEELKTLGLTSESVAELLSNIGSYVPGILADNTGFEMEDNDELPFFCRDMNAQAQKGEFLNITGRDEEIERMIHILSRKTKNNPILVGDAGVGKTAVVQGMVQRIVRGEVPPSFIDKQVLSLDVAAIIAGSRVRGDVEERILTLVNDVISAQNKIIFIDEIHMIVGAGSYGGRDTMDIGNILKPYLTDPNLRIIGATTVAEYRRNFDDDPALSRRFQPIDVDELDQEHSVEILEALKPDFEAYHGVRIKQEALEDAVKLSSKFIADRFLPDKAIDVIDEAAASIKIGREIEIEPQLSALGSKLISAQKRKEKAMDERNLDAAYKARQSEESITEKIADLMEGKAAKSKSKVVDSALIRRVIVNWTKIPLAAGDLSTESLHKIDAKLHARIIGQDQVLSSVTSALKRSHLGLNTSKRPLASFLFLGPTGVGKTELAKSIAEELFGSSESLVQLNMSEYMEMHSVAKLIGAPPGYVGYQEGGQLTERVRRRPYSVVLFDEIEKSHPDVWNLLLQILEEGELTDGKGRKTNFQNTVVILTSNIGAEEVSKDRKLGFDVAPEELQADDFDEAYESMRDGLLDSLKQEVRPELLNRLDEIVIFRGLNEKDCEEITQSMVTKLLSNLREAGIALTIPKAAIKLISSQGYSKEYGVRNLRRKLQELVENPLADYLINHKVKRSKKDLLSLKVEVEGEKLVFSK